MFDEDYPREENITKQEKETPEEERDEEEYKRAKYAFGFGG